jgi:Ser/Thr protein kinase RdoA (MazF antagonist)
MEQVKQMQRSRQRHLPIIQRYTENVLLPALGYSGDVRIESAFHGSTSHLYFIEGKGLKPLVLRGEERKAGIKRRIRGHRLLLQHGFDVPHILHQNLNSSVKKKFGFYFVAETRILGPFFKDAEDAADAGFRLGVLLARMHTVTSWGYGWPGEWRWPGSILAGLKLRVQANNLLRVYRQKNGHAPEMIAQFLKQQPSRNWFPQPRLTTGGFISSNVMIQGDQVIIIDLARVRYAFAARDLAQIRFVFTRYDETARTGFFEGYRQQASQSLWSEIEKTLPLFKVIFLLRLAVKETNAERCEELLKYCRH